MDTYLLSHLIILVGLLLASMFFSAVEASLLSYPRLALQRKAQEPGLLGTAFKEWHEHPNRILTGILIGNNLVNIMATTLVAYTAVHVAEVCQWSRAMTGLVASVAIAVVLILFGETVPKVAARNNSVRMGNLLIVPIYLFDRLVGPFTWAMTGLVKGILPKFLGSSAVVQVTEEDVKQLIEMGQKAGTIQEDEKNMIHSIFKFTDTKVSEVMIPRTEMFCVDIRTETDRLLDLVVQGGYSRMPVYKGNIDNIIGIIHSRDLLSLWRNKELIVLHDLIRKPHFVPETMRVDRLLREFRRGRYHMAVVVDEYGGTAGLVTLEDLVEEIVGEIHEEHEGEEERAIQPQPDGSWVIEANISIDEVNRALNAHFLPKGDVASLGGYLTELIGRVPRKGRVIDDQEAVFTILDASEKRIQKVKVIKRKTPLPAPEMEAPPASKPRKKRARAGPVDLPVEKTPSPETPLEATDAHSEKPS